MIICFKLTTPKKIKCTFLRRAMNKQFCQRLQTDLPGFSALYKCFYYYSDLFQLQAYKCY